MKRILLSLALLSFGCAPSLKEEIYGRWVYPHPGVRCPVAPGIPCIAATLTLTRYGFALRGTSTSMSGCALSTSTTEGDWFVRYPNDLNLQADCRATAVSCGVHITGVDDRTACFAGRAAWRIVRFNGEVDRIEAPSAIGGLDSFAFYRSP